MWRLYKTEDRSSLEQLRGFQEQRLGTQMDMPDPMDRPVLVTLVHEKNGVLTNAIILEAAAEVMAFGGVAIPRGEWAEGAKMLKEVCDAYKLRIARAYVPVEALQAKKPKRLTPVGRILQYLGFQREDVSKLIPFSKWLA